MKKITGFLFTILTLFLAASCNIGLGHSVDVEVPAIEITSPNAGAVIRDSFAILGTWSDDGSVKSVDVSLKGLSNGTSSIPALAAEVITDESTTEGTKGRWSVVIEPKKQNAVIVDGSYEVTIVIKDNGGHKTTISRQYVIDNTPPVIVLQRPGTEYNVELSAADSYGQTFTLEGQGADDNNIDLINVSVYGDLSSTKPLATIPLQNVPPTIQLDVTKFGEDAYTAIYGSSEKNGAKQLYCRIEAYDGAQRYPVAFDVNQSAADLLGNRTTSYYLYDDVSTLKIGENKCKVTDLYHMMSGVYGIETSNSSDRAAVSPAVETVLGLLEIKEKKIGSFSLNPENNPKFTLTGHNPIKASDMDLSKDTDYSITNGTTGITIEVSPGLDNTPLVDDDNLKVYVVECKNNGTPVAGAKKIYLESVKSKSGSNYKLTFGVDNSKGLVIGKTYLFGVSGKDSDGNDIIASDINGYGFYLASSGKAPELKIEKPETSTVYVNQTGTLRVKGYTTVETGAPVISVVCNDQVWKPVTFEESQRDASVENKNKYYFDFVIDNETLRSKADKKDDVPVSTEFAISIVSAQGDVNSSFQKTVILDLDKPVITLNNNAVSPMIESYAGAFGANSEGKRPDGYYYSNGIISASGLITDATSVVSEYTWKLLKSDGNSAETIPGVGDTVKKSSIDISFDSRELADVNNKVLTLSITAKDAAENDVTEEFKFVVDQTTDRPTFTSQDGTSWKTGIRNPTYINSHSAEDDTLRTNVLSGDLYSKLCDDDGVASVRFIVKAIEMGDENITAPGVVNYTYKENPLVYDKTYGNKSGTETSASQKMPSAPGFYEITEIVFDKNYDASKDLFYNANYFRAEVYVVKVQGTGPQFTLGRESPYISTSQAGSKASVKVTIDQGEAPYIIKRKVKTTAGSYAEVDLSNSLVTPADSAPYINDEFAVTGIDFSGKIDVTYIITDVNGTTEKDLDYTVDNDAPATLSITSPAETPASVGDSALYGDSATIRGSAKDVDGGSGMKHLWYAITAADGSEPDWTDSNNYTEVDAGDGIWNIVVTLKTGKGTSSNNTLYEGSYKLWVKAVDAAGNISSVVSRVFDVDQAEPVMQSATLSYNTATTTTPVSLTADSTKFFKSASTDGNFVIKGTVKETQGIKTFKINNTDRKASLTGGTNGIYTFTYEVSYAKDTKITIPVEIVDSVGRKTSKSYSIYCDTEAPNLEITNPDYSTELTGRNALSKSKETFRSNVNDANGEGSGVVSYKYIISNTKLNDIVSSAETGTGWTTVTNKSDIADTKNLVSTYSNVADTRKTQLIEGSWYFYVYAKDAMGNTSVLEKPFWIDLSDPVLTFDKISTPRKDAVVLKGSASDSNGITSVSLKINNVEEQADIKTAFTSSGYTLEVGEGKDLPDGEYTILVTATDGAGKTTEQSQTITVDTTPPVHKNGAYEKPSTTVTVGSKNWSKSTSYGIKIKNSAIVENGSGISSVDAVILKYGETAAYESSQSLKNNKDNADNLQKWSGTLEIPEQGPNNIFVRILDNAGNSNTGANSSIGIVYLDTLQPDADSIKVYEEAAEGDAGAIDISSSEESHFYVKPVTGTKYVKGDSKVVVYVTAQDNKTGVPSTKPTGTADGDYYSGIKTVKYQYGNNEYIAPAADASIKTGYYKIEIPANTSDTTYQNGSAKFLAEDNAGNSCSPVPVFTFDVDNISPTVTIDPVTDADTESEADDTDVNGVLTVTGTARDANSLSSITMYYVVGTKDKPSANAWKDAESKTVTVNTNWSVSLDTKSSTDGFINGKYVHMKVAATDAAGNEGVSSVTTVHINQDSDRPVITFLNLDIAAPSNIWLTGQSRLTGLVTDDDGVTSMKYKDVKGENSWKPVTLTNGSWYIDVGSDGSHEYYFEVVDKAGSTFKTKTEEGDSTLTQPKLKSEVSAKAWIGTSATGNVILSFKKDTTTPKFVPDTVRYKTSEKDWQKNSSDLNFGGIYNTFDFKLNAWDANGVDSIALYFNESETPVNGVITCEQGKEEETKLAGNSVNNAKEWTFSNIAIANTVKGNTKIKVVLTDKSNQQFEDSFTINVDNTKPVLKFTSPKPQEQVFATTSVQVMGVAEESDIKEWYYVLNESSTKPALSAIKADTSKKTLTAGSTPGMSFTIVFDGSSSTTTEVHDSTLFKKIIDLENIQKGSYATPELNLEKNPALDNVRDMYIWAYGTDKSGNDSEVIGLNLKVIPNGDKPSVTVTYPSANQEKETTLGGTVRVTGGTEIQNQNVTAVYVQIDPQPEVAYVSDANGKYYLLGTVYKSDDGMRYKPGTDITADTVDTSESSTDPNKAVVFTESNEGTYLKDGDTYRLVSKLSFYKKTVTFTEAWESHLDARIGTKETGKKTADYYTAYTTDTGFTGNYKKAIKASGTVASWNITLNSKGEFNLDTENYTTSVVALRVFAKSSTGKMSDPVVVWYNNDKNSPQISNLELVKRAGDAANGAIIARQPYDDDMWLKGLWYLTGDVTDNSGIKKIEFTDSQENINDIVAIIDAENAIGKIVTGKSYSNYVDQGTAVGENYNYRLNIPIGNATADQFGKLSYKIVAYEGTGTDLSAEQTISIRYDNKAPEFAYKNSSGTNYADKTASTPSSIDMSLDDGTFIMNGTVVEQSGEGGISQSEFSRVAVYFTRTRNSSLNVIDPMLPNITESNNGYANYVETATTATASKPCLDNTDKLYWYKFAGAAIQNNVITVKETLPKSVRNGGLAKVNGVYYPIYSEEGNPVNYKEKTIVIKGSVSDTASVDVYVAVAQIIDHKATEGSSVKNKTSQYVFKDDDTGDVAIDSSIVNTNDKTNDDGDQMIEKVTVSSVTASWQAGIDTSLIMDGDVTINFVAFDNAGNTTFAAYNGNVKNNAPRIYGVKYGTDRNGNGVIDDNEWINDYKQKFSVLTAGADTEEDDTDDEYIYGYEKVSGQKSKKYEFGVSETLTRMTVKGLTSVVPQIVGGNNGLSYTIGYQPAKDSASETSIKSATSINSTHSTGVRSEYTISLGAGDFLSASGLTGNKYLSYKIWDKTDGLTVGSDSYFARILLPVKMEVKDTEAPTAVFNKFYWNSSTENSLFKNSTENGHIELESDWTAVDEASNKLAGWDGKTDSSTLYDSDPKVSGTITFDCVAQDNVIVQELKAFIPAGNGTAYTEAPAGWPTGFYSDSVCITAAPDAFAAGTYYKKVETTIAKRNASGDWVSSKTVDNTTTSITDWGFQLVDDVYNDEGKNTVNFKLHFNTASISTVAAINVGLEIKAYDRGQATSVEGKTTAIKYSTAKADTNGYLWFTDESCTTLATNETADNANVYRVAYTPENSTPGTVSTSAGDNRTGLYKVDIVPYITGVTTELSAKSKKVSSVFDRSALGHYPVRSGETVTLKGFNLATTSINTSSLSSGEYTATTNNISSLNNKNLNNAVGTSGKEYTDNTYAYCYNRKPNGLTNETLTDDIYFDVWEFKNAASANGTAKIYYPVMHINPKNNQIGFGFGNGAAYLSLPNAATADSKYSSTSYSLWQKNYADYEGIAFAYDSKGYVHSVSIGLDTEPNNGYAGYMQYIYSPWGGSGSNVYNWNKQTTVALESLGIPKDYYVNGKKLTGNVLDLDRFGQPALAVNSRSTPTAYVAYYDTDSDQIRFRYGTIGETRYSSNKYTNYDQINDSKVAKGTRGNDTGGQSYAQHTMFEAHPDYYSLIAGKSWDQTEEDTVTSNTGNGTSEYVALDVISSTGSTLDDDIVVVVWYDGKDLKYTYRYGKKDDTDCNSNGVAAVTTGTNQHGGWSKPKTIFEGAGQYCAIKVAPDNSIHIAGYDRSNADVYYGYLNTYDSETVSTALVDSYSTVGKHISIDTALVSANGNVIPYITYFADGYNSLPKLAYLPGGVKTVSKTTKDETTGKNVTTTTVTLPNGSDISTDEFTGSWEVEVIPTNSVVQDDNMNIGLFKSSSGVLTKPSQTADTTGANTANRYPNGTSNIVLGYATVDGTNGYIETAQMK